MASDPPAASALVPYTGGESFGNPQRWALAINPIPGRTLNEFYSTAAQALETRANRMAYLLGLGPDVIAGKIRSFFSTGDERELKLTALRIEVPMKLEGACSKLMEYTLPYGSFSSLVTQTAHYDIYFTSLHSKESPKTQRQAFERIIALTTFFPGLRCIFLRSECMTGIPISREDITALWDRPNGSLDPEWSFWRTFAATCLADTSIAVMLEETPISRLANCPNDTGGLGVIERLLVAHSCE